MKCPYLILWMVLLPLFSFSQGKEKIKHPKQREIGVNLTGLLSQIAPFQTSTTFTGPFQMEFRGGRNNHFFALKVGARIQDFENDNFLNLSFGYTRRKVLSKKFNFDMGYNLLIIGGSFNDPINDTRDIGAFGFGWDLGFQFKLSDRVSLSTSTTLFVGPTTEGFLSITFIPPVGIFLTGRLK